MTQKVEEAIHCWTSRATWFTSHPSDVAEFNSAVSNLKNLEYLPSFEELESIIYKCIKDRPVVLGTPKDLQTTVRDFTVKIWDKL